MPQSYESVPDASSAPAIRPPLGPIGRLALGMLPLWTLLIESVVAPSTIDSLGANPPAIVGLPIGMLVVAVALLVGAVGALGLYRSSSTTSMILWLSLVTVPSTAAVLAAPALMELLRLAAM